MSTKRILIVDDDSNIQTMLRVCLAGESVLIELAANGSQALDIVCKNPPDLMLLDLAMPVMDGMTLLTHLRSLPASAQPRVIVMTAHGSVKTAIQAMRMGARDFLEKPFTPDEVRLSVFGTLDEPNMITETASDGYDAVLQSAREALRARTLVAAEALLTKAGVISDEDPAFLNLVGALHEARGRTENAKRFYERAAHVDHRYAPANENLMRLADLRRSGSSNRTIMLGDEFIGGDSHVPRITPTHHK